MTDASAFYQSQLFCQHLPQDIPVAVEPKWVAVRVYIGAVKKDALLPNYPNPFNPETWIPYQLAAVSSVQIHIYDLMGRQVRTLDLGQQPAGAYLSRKRAAYWDGRNVLGRTCCDGHLFLSVRNGRFHRDESDGDCQIGAFLIHGRSKFHLSTIRIRFYLIPLKCRLLSVRYSSQTWEEHDEKRASTLFVYIASLLLNGSRRLRTNR